MDDDELMDDREFIDDRIAALKESVKYFGNKNKPERERCVCAEFLSNLRIPFADADIQSPATDPPDVVFADARFEIKEILDPGRKRHDEYKQQLAHAERATDPHELLTLFTPKDITPTEICQRVLETLQELGDRYLAGERSGIDLLFHVNLKHHTLTEGLLPDLTRLREFGWRSINVLMGWSSFVLYAAEDAPSFLIESSQKVVQREFQIGCPSAG